MVGAWNLQGDHMRPELSMVSAALEPQDHEDFERVRKLKGMSKTDFLKFCIRNAVAVHDYNTMKDWHPAIVITRSDERTEPSEYPDTPDRYQYPSIKAKSIRIRECGRF